MKGFAGIVEERCSETFDGTHGDSGESIECDNVSIDLACWRCPDVSHSVGVRDSEDQGTSL